MAASLFLDWAWTWVDAGASLGPLGLPVFAASVFIGVGALGTFRVSSPRKPVSPPENSSPNRCLLSLWVQIAQIAEFLHLLQ